MKPSLLLLSLLSVGCMRYPNNTLDYDRLANLPTEPHDREVAILFAQDPLPSEPYVKIGVLETRGGEYTPYNELIRNLQAQAQELGVDAIQLFDKKYIEDPENYDLTYTHVTSTLAGLGILYLENAPYLEQYIQSKELYRYHDSTGQYDELLGRMELSYDGTPPRVTGPGRYADLFSNYDLQHLRYEETDDWWFNTDRYGRVDQRGYSPNGVLRKECRFTYNELGQVVEVRIRYINRLPREERVQFQYDDAGRVVEKLIVRPGQFSLRVIPTYDEQGRWVGSDYLRARDERFEPYLRMVHRFFDPDNLSINGSLVKATP